MLDVRSSLWICVLLFSSSIPPQIAIGLVCCCTIGPIISIVATETPSVRGRHFLDSRTLTRAEDEVTSVSP